MRGTSFHFYQHERKQERSTRCISLSDFPQRHSCWSHYDLNYFEDHNVVVDRLSCIENIYPVPGGICFVLAGPLNFQVRLTGSIDGSRFYTPPGSPIGQNLFVPAIHPMYENYSFRNMVVITEGTTDALAVAQHGVTAVALMGAKPTQDKMELLMFLFKDMDMYLIPDNDVAGLTLVSHFYENKLLCNLALLPDAVKDFCDLTLQEQESFLYSLWQKHNDKQYKTIPYQASCSG